MYVHYMYITCTLHVQLLSAHYEHFVRYYQSSGVLDKTSLGVPTEEEKTCSALVVYRLLNALSAKVCVCM